MNILPTRRGRVSVETAPCEQGVAIRIVTESAPDSGVTKHDEALSKSQFELARRRIADMRGTLNLSGANAGQIEIILPTELQQRAAEPAGESLGQARGPRTRRDLAAASGHAAPPTPGACRGREAPPRVCPSSPSAQSAAASRLHREARRNTGPSSPVGTPPSGTVDGESLHSSEVDLPPSVV